MCGRRGGGAARYVRCCGGRVCRRQIVATLETHVLRHQTLIYSDTVKGNETVLLLFGCISTKAARLRPDNFSGYSGRIVGCLGLGLQFPDLPVLHPQSSYASVARSVVCAENRNQTDRVSQGSYLKLLCFALVLFDL